LLIVKPAPPLDTIPSPSDHHNLSRVRNKLTYLLDISETEIDVPAFRMTSKPVVMFGCDTRRVAGKENVKYCHVIVTTDEVWIGNRI
jgi:hypothetical protein